VTNAKGQLDELKAAATQAAQAVEAQQGSVSAEMEEARAAFNALRDELQRVAESLGIV
jgi:HAMP domain-containing protein